MTRTHLHAHRVALVALRPHLQLVAARVQPQRPSLVTLHHRPIDAHFRIHGRGLHTQRHHVALRTLQRLLHLHTLVSLKRTPPGAERLLEPATCLHVAAHLEAGHTQRTRRRRTSPDAVRLHEQLVRLLEVPRAQLLHRLLHQRTVLRGL